jgi:mannosylglycerate hydrolase
VLANGPVVYELEVAIEAQRPAGLETDERARLTVTTVVRLIEGTDRIEFRTTIENPCRDHRLRVVFGAGEADGPVRAEGQFAVVRRPLAPPAPTAEWVEPPDPTQHTLGAVALGELALITQGMPEYEARARDGTAELCLTLVRCVGVISKPSDAIATRPRGAGPQVPTPEGQCLGTQQAEYALVLGADELDDLALLRGSQDYRCGCIVVPDRFDFTPTLRLDGDVVFSALKGAEDGDGVVLRCFNPARSAVTARVEGELSADRARLDETGEEPLPDRVFEVGGGQVATVRLRPR